jgi:hypothetical protein
MQADYPASFERDTGGTEAEWLRRLPGACHGHPIRVGTGRARVQIDAGSLQLDWLVLPPRRIALMTMPRMSVRFHFEGLDDEARQRFMRSFDLHMQRGGG